MAETRYLAGPEKHCPHLWSMMPQLQLLVLLFLLSFFFLLTGGSFFQGDMKSLIRNLEHTVCYHPKMLLEKLGGYRGSCG